LQRIVIGFCKEILPRQGIAQGDVVAQGGFVASVTVEGVMSGHMPKPIGPIALVAALLMSGASFAVPAEAARADDCVTAPNSSAPQGSHWYYHLDRAQQRKCWYLRALGQPAQQATAQPSAEAVPAVPLRSVPTASMPAVASAGAPMSDSAGDSAPPPHVKILAVKPQPAPMRSTAADEPGQSAQAESAAPSIPQALASQPSAPQSSARPAGPGPAAPTAWPDPSPAAAAFKAKQPIAGSSDARARSIESKSNSRTSDDESGIAQRREATANVEVAGGPPMTALEMFLVLVLGLAVAGILSRVVLKIAASRREPVIIDYRQSDFTEDQHQHEWPDDRPRHEFVDDRRQQDFYDGQRELEETDSLPSGRTRPSAARPRDLGIATAGPLSTRVGDLEAALRIITRARQLPAA
jgi:hypothetical protein